MNTDTISMQHPELKHIMEINYCLSGRIGWKMENESGRPVNGVSIGTD